MTNKIKQPVFASAFLVMKCFLLVRRIPVAVQKALQHQQAELGVVDICHLRRGGRGCRRTFPIQTFALNSADMLLLSGIVG